jgi:hypothetical protein
LRPVAVITPKPFRMRQRTTGRASFDTREFFGFEFFGFEFFGFEFFGFEFLTSSSWLSGDWLRFRRMYC